VEGLEVRLAVTGASGLLGRRLVAEGAFPVPRGSLDFAHADAVVHLAARTIVREAWADPVATFEANVALTWRVLAAARSSGVPRAVVASSDAVYGPFAPLPTPEDAPLAPADPYGASKAAADVLARAFPGIDVAVARLGSLYGPGDRHMSRLVPGAIAAVLEGRSPVIRGDGSAARDLLHVDDAAAGLRILATEGRAGEAYNVGSGRPTSVREVVDAVLAAAGSDLEPVVLGDTPPGEGGSRALDTAKLRRLGWSPAVRLEDGIRATLQWHQAEASS
jgi:CDP-glucose 4,6-dehydratase